MNFQSERNKPLFVVRGSDVALANTRMILNEAIVNRSANKLVNFSNEEYIIKAAAAERLPSKVQVSVEQSTTEELKELVKQRLEAGTEKFEFLDGSVFTGHEAALEVERNSRIGRYFFDLEIETLRIAQQAFREGKF